MRAKDGAGNWGATAHYGANIDCTVPVTSAEAPSSWVTSATVVLASSESSVTTRYRVDSGQWAVYSAPVRVTSDGTHTVEYYSVDKANNTEVPQAVTVRVDATPPQTSDDAVESYLGSAR